MKTNLKQSLIAVALMVIFSGFSNPSLAGGFSKKIGYSDLDLEQPADVAVLYERIKHAAKIVCTDKTAIWGYHRRNFNRCYQRVVNKAVTSMDNNMLTTLHPGQENRVAKQ